MPKCHKCGVEKPVTEFVPTMSDFHPKGRSSWCLVCIEKAVDPSNLNAVDKMC